MVENLKHSEEKDVAIDAVPLERRESWVSPAVVYAGVEFTLSVVMVGAGLVGSFSVAKVAMIVAVALLITWVGDSLNAYIGAKTGRASTVIARQSFGSLQARTLVALLVIIMGLGWWGVQTAIMANAISIALGIDYTASWGAWALIVVILGVIFGIPAILGYTSMKWTDYLAVPVGLFIFGLGVYLSVMKHGVSGIINWNPTPQMTIAVAISTVIGVNVVQWVMISDYSRQTKPGWKNAVLVPSLTMAVGFILMVVGAIMAVGVGTWDIVAVMVALGYPFWAYFMMFVAQWTTQIVNVYTPGLALSNMLNLRTGRARAMATAGIVIVGMLLALAGILSRYMDFLLLLGIVFPPIAAVMMTDFFVLRKEEWEDIQGWNLMATLALVVGILSGYYMQYKHFFGLPAIQTFIITSIAYYLLMRLKASTSPDKFTPRHWLS
ncbi:permease [Thermococcus sp. 21S7]|nr:permease [Thermococcus sp. 21S7]